MMLQAIMKEEKSGQGENIQSSSESSFADKAWFCSPKPVQQTEHPRQISSLGVFPLLFSFTKCFEPSASLPQLHKERVNQISSAKHEQTNIPQMPRKLGKPNDRLEPTNIHLMVWRIPSNPDFLWLFNAQGDASILC